MDSLLPMKSQKPNFRCGGDITCAVAAAESSSGPEIQGRIKTRLRVASSSNFSASSREINQFAHFHTGYAAGYCSSSSSKSACPQGV